MNSSKPIGFRTKSKSETSEQTWQQEFLYEFPLRYVCTYITIFRSISLPLKIDLISLVCNKKLFR